MNTLLKFSASWCSTCPVLSKILKTIDLGSTILVEVDIDKEQTTVNAYNIRALPTLVLLDETGEEIKRCTGVKTKEQLLQFLNVNN